jgi:hypothetical protein
VSVWFEGTVLSPRELTGLVVYELSRQKCRCFAPKERRHTFCKHCYYALPFAMRRKLYDRVGEGYEAAYVAAVRFLAAEGRMERPEWMPA